MSETKIAPDDWANPEWDGGGHVQYCIKRGVELMSEWQPIETAPKDGTVILIWLPDFQKVCTAWFCHATGLWPSDYPYSEEGEPCNVGRLTHWMPLPEPPQGDEND